MNRSRILTSLAAAVLGISLLGACSAESLTEFGLERALEAQGEGDVDLDFSNGGFNLNSDEGNFSINFDEDNGGIFFDTEDGSGSIVFDGEGNIVYDTDDGSGTVNVSENGIVVDSDDDSQDTTWSFSDNGSGTTVTTEEGVSQFGMTTPPDSWPSFIGIPATNQVGETTYSVMAQGGQAIHSATFYHDAAEPYAQTTIDTLLANGFASQFTQTSPESILAQLASDQYSVTVMGEASGFTSVTISPVS